MITTILIGLIVNGPIFFLMYRQTTLIQEQNRILQAQRGIDMSVPVAKSVVLRRYWPMLAMVSLTLLIWAAVGFDYYDRHHSDTSNWANYAYKEISDAHYSLQTVPLDGYRYINPTFDRVTFVYEGTAPSEVINATMVGHGDISQPGFKIQSHNPVVQITMKIDNSLAGIAGCKSIIEESPHP
jgi:hypothetical protein